MTIQRLSKLFSWIHFSRHRYELGTITPYGEFKRDTFHFFILLRVNFIFWREAMMISLDYIIIESQVIFCNLYFIKTFRP